MFSFDLLMVVTAAIGNVIIGLFSFLKNPKNNTNRLFTLFTLIISLYLTINYFSLHQPNAMMFLLFVRIVMSLAIMINLFFYLLCYVFPSGKINYFQGKIIFIFIISIFVSALAQTPLIFKTIDPATNQPVPGMAIPLFLIHTIVFLGWGIFLLIKKVKNGKGIEKVQSKIFLLGTSVMFGLIMISNVILVVFFKISSFVTFLPIYTLIFDIVVAYAIIRHRFLDVSFVVARTVSYSILIVMLGILYAFLFAVIPSFFMETKFLDTRTISVSTALALIMAFSFQTVRRKIESITDKIFYKNHYSSDKLLYDMALIMASTLRFEDLSHQFLTTLISDMRISKAAIVLAAEEQIFDVAQEGYTTIPTFSEINVFELIKQNTTLIFDELPENEIKQIMRDLDISMAVNITTAGEQMGILLIGGKLSGDIFNIEDFKVIDILISELAVAIKNALSYDEISKFNLTLKSEIDLATTNLRQANTQLKQLDKLKDEFVSVASHELRSPMTAIKNYLWLAIDKTKNEKGDLQNYLMIAYSSTERLLRLVEDMLTVSRIEGKRLILKSEKVNLSEVLKQIYDELVINAEKNNLKVNLKLNPGVHFVIGDKEKLMEVFENLFSNAVKFTPTGGHIDISLDKKDDQFVINFFNSDSYISKENAAKLFEKFRQLDMSTTKTPEAKGTGLGLYISKQIVELHHGKIEVVSDENKGTSFIIYLPIEK